jgi:hypothetical protein
VGLERGGSQGVERGIATSETHELVVRTALENAPSLEKQNQAGAGGQPEVVSDPERTFPFFTIEPSEATLRIVVGRFLETDARFPAADVSWSGLPGQLARCGVVGED